MKPLGNNKHISSISLTHTIDIPPFLISVRCLLAVAAFLGYCVQYMLKINLGIAIVCMVNHTALDKYTLVKNQPNLSYSTQLNTTTTCLIKETNSNHLDGKYVWSKSEQGFALASYFYGYLITQIPGGWLSGKYGGRNILGITNLIASGFTMLIPFFSQYGYLSLSACRFLIGLAHGVFWPAMSSIFVSWAPARERTKIIGTSTAGAWVGNIVALPLAGYLCVNGFGGGWPSIFYVFGIVGVLWSILFLVLITNSPRNHQFITAREKDYLIRETIKEVSARESGMLKTPWKEIFKSKVCWATFIAHFCNNWGNYLYLTQLPSFMKDVLKFDIKSNGFMSAIPYVACAISTASLSILSDKIIRSEFISRQNVRRIFTAVGFLLPAASVVCLSFVTCSSPYLGVAFLTLGLALNGFYWSAGPLVNINDIAGSYSGVVFGITNTFGTLPGIICPYLVGLITKHQTQREWATVFIICAAVYTVGTVVYVKFCETNLQSWAIVEMPPPPMPKQPSISHVRFSVATNLDAKSEGSNQSSQMAPEYEYSTF